MAASVKPFLADKFGPTDLGVEWTRWKRNFGYFLEFNNIVDVNKKRSLLLLLGGEQIQEIAENLDNVDQAIGQQPGEDGANDTYTSLMDMLNGHFASSLNVTVERHVFNHMKQNADEKMEQFAVRLRTQGKRCDFGNQLNSNIRDRLIAGCIFLDLRRDLLRKGDASLKEVLDQAKVAEAVDAHVKKMGDDRHIPGPASAVVNKINVTRDCGRCGRPLHKDRNKCPALGKTCHKCGKIVHFSMKCRSPATGTTVAAPDIARQAYQAGDNKNKGRRYQPYNQGNGFQSNRRGFRPPAGVNNVEVDQDEVAKVNLIESQASKEQNDPFDRYVFSITSPSTSKNQIMGIIGGVRMSGSLIRDPYII